MDRDHAPWCFYRHPGDEHELPTRPSYAITAACYQAKLFRIIDESLNLYCGARGQVSAEKTLAVYKRYVDWKNDLPSMITDVDASDQPLPHILYLQYVSAFEYHEHGLTGPASNITLLWCSISARCSIAAGSLRMIMLSWFVLLCSTLEAVLNSLPMRKAFIPRGSPCLS